MCRASDKLWSALALWVPLVPQSVSAVSRNLRLYKHLVDRRLQSIIIMA